MNPHLNDLTVFIISTGEETTAECEKALSEQNCSFNIKHIRDTYPMYRAFQRMPDECDTKYFIQVDSDVILKPRAVQTLYNGIKHSSFMTYMVYGQLYEEGFGVGGSVRCWKRRLFKYFRFRDCRTVDRDIYRRVRWIGLRARNINQILGLHLARHSPFSNYLKTKSDIEKWRFLRRTPEKYALKVLDKNIENLPTSSSELLGALLGALTAKERLMRSKDIKLENERYNEVMRYLNSDGNLDEINNLGVKGYNLKTIFCKSYIDINDNHIESKLLLADMVIKIFGRESMVSPDELLKILAR